jgi:hypothetical protein
MLGNKNYHLLNLFALVHIGQCEPTLSVVWLEWSTVESLFSYVFQECKAHMGDFSL